MISFLREVLLERVAYAAIWIWEFYQSSTYETRNTPASWLSIEPGYSDDMVELLIKTENLMRRQAGEPPFRRRDAPPRVVVTWPLPCAVVDRPVDVVAVASDGVRGVERIEFMIDGLKFATVTSLPYHVQLDPKGLAPKVVSVTARAFGAEGHSAEFSSLVRLNDTGDNCKVPP